jgi:hypothetical protein
MTGLRRAKIVNSIYYETKERTKYLYESLYGSRSTINNQKKFTTPAEFFMRNPHIVNSRKGKSLWTSTAGGMYATDEQIR